MFQERIFLTAKDILEKEFKIDTRGYRPQEVDKFLDIVMRDYEEMMNIIKELDNDRKNLASDNIKLKQELRNFQAKLEVLKDNNGEITNADLLRRLSNLEKVIYGRE
jgi:DivIVA domain-containing protein